MEVALGPAFMGLTTGKVDRPVHTWWKSQMGRAWSQEAEPWGVVEKAQAVWSG